MSPSNLCYHLLPLGFRPLWSTLDNCIGECFLNFFNIYSMCRTMTISKNLLRVTSFFWVENNIVDKTYKRILQTQENSINENNNLRLFLTSFLKMIVSDPIKFLKNSCKITDEPIIYSYLKSDFPTLFSFCFLLSLERGEIDGEEEEEDAEEEEGEGATDQKNSRTQGDRRREHPSERRTPSKKKKKKKKPKTPKKKKKKSRTQEREGELDPFDRERVRVRSDDGEVRLRFVRLRSMFAVGLEAVHLAVCDYRSLSPVKPKLSSTFQVNSYNSVFFSSSDFNCNMFSYFILSI
ncbi:hypothetical protein ACOSQ2_002625 [Xanthoceras sorbifolium]